MKSYDLIPNYENIKTALLENKLERNKFLFRFITLLQSIEDMNCSIALDAQWGAGKTFFVKQAKLILDVINPYIQTDHLSENVKDDYDKILKLIEKNGITNNPQLCVYYNAWENDNTEDPILSLIYSISQNISTDIQITDGKRDIGEIVKSIIKLLDFQVTVPIDSSNQTTASFGIDGQKITDVIDAFKKKKEFGHIEHELTLKNEMNEFLNSLLPEKANRLVIFIDELDRCKPLYAVTLLERIKHYFDNPNITFVFSTNLNELQNTIKNLYGEQFSASRYLDKFFDITIQLPPITVEQYFDYLGIYSNSNLIKMAIAKVCNLGLREINHFITLSNIANNMLRKTNRYFFENDNYYNLIIDCITPLLIALKMTNQKDYDDFISGEKPELFVSVFNDDSLASSCLDSWGMIDITGGDLRTNDKRFAEIYKFLFIEAGKYHHRKTIGNLTIPENCMKDIFEITSLLSDFAGYED